MTDYRDQQAANRRAHKYRWYVWLAVPTMFALVVVANSQLVRDLANLARGLWWWSFGKGSPL